MELGRLGKAQVHAKKAYDVARRGKVAAPVLHDVQVCVKIFHLYCRWSLCSLFWKHWKAVMLELSATMIWSITKTYLLRQHSLPCSRPSLRLLSFPRLCRIRRLSQEINISYLVNLQDGELVKRSVIIFPPSSWLCSNSLPDIYNDRKNNLIEENIVDIAQELQDQVDQYVSSRFHMKNGLISRAESFGD